MAGIAAILRWQWVAYWRSFRRRGNLTAGNQGVAILLAGICLFKYLQALRVTARELSAGRTTLFEALLTGLFLAWLYPIASNSLLISSRRLLHLPLSVRELFGIRIVSLLIPLYAWLIVGGSLALLYPLISAPHPWSGMLACVLFIVTSYCIGLTLSHLTLTARGRIVLLLMLLVALLVVGLMFINSDAASLRSLSPMHLVANIVTGASSWRSLLILGALALLSFWLAAWTFRHSLEAGEPTFSQHAPILRTLKFPGRFGLITKDFRHFRRLLDPYFGLLITILCGAYLITAKEPGPELLWFFLILFFMLNATVAFNLFGFDDLPGLDRYKLLPLSGRMIIASKNLMFVAITGLQMLVLLVLAAWRLGFYDTLLSMIETVVLMLGFMAWGNWMSVRYPAKLQYYRAASGGPLVEVILALVLASLPALICAYFLLSDKSHALWKMMLVMFVCVVVYVFSIDRAGRYFDRKSERIKEVLA
jgi:hypothetical protein